MKAQRKVEVEVSARVVIDDLHFESYIYNEALIHNG